MEQHEAELYDRQIRVWGVDAQIRMRKSRVLSIFMTALNAEVCKNLVLAGIGSLTVCDSATVELQDCGSNFLFSENDCGKNRAVCCAKSLRELNPNVQILVNQDSISKCDGDYLVQFDLVVATDLKLKEQLRINSLCHEQQVPFFTGQVFGYSSYFFEDLAHHEYTIKRSNSDGQEQVFLEAVDFSSLKEVLQRSSWPHLAKAFGRKAQKHAALIYLIFGLSSSFPDQRRGLGTAFQKFVDDHGCNPNEQQLLDAVKSDSAFPTSLASEFSSLLRGAGHEVSHVCAMTGGIMGQEILKVGLSVRHR